MSDTLPFLKSLISVSGLSGYEAPVAAIIEKRWKPLVDEISISRLGSLHGLKKGNGKSPRPSVLIDAHMDAIGMMVSRISDGFLHVTEIGSINPRVLPGSPVIVHASGSGEDLPGVVVIPLAQLLPDGEGKDTVALKYMLVDTGLTAREVLKQVHVGDLISFNTEPIELSGETVSGHSLDNRSSIVALTICLEELQSRPHLWDVWAVASTQEEVSLAGARTSAFQLRPSIAIVVDTSYGKGPGTDGWNTFAIGEGPTLAIGPNVHPFLRKRFQDVANKAGFPVTLEPMPLESLTNADAMQLTAEGLPMMVIGIPLRNMHTPVEIVSMKDVKCTGRLLAEFAASLEEDFMEMMVWE